MKEYCKPEVHYHGRVYGAVPALVGWGVGLGVTALASAAANKLINGGRNRSGMEVRTVALDSVLCD